MAADRCIIAFANEAGNYKRGLARLMESLVAHFDGAVLTYTDEKSIGSPPHSENPYAFKLFCFLKAMEAGYTKILYLDCSVAAIRDVNPVFDMLDKQPVVLQEAGHYLSRWINEPALRYFGISRDALDRVRMHGNAGFLGINFTTDLGKAFFDKWYSAMAAGAFRGSWSDHRHDMSCGSMIAWLMGLQKYYLNGEEILEYAIPGTSPKNDSIIFQAAGM